jgi:two-component system chemotaxis response regulator CheB
MTLAAGATGDPAARLRVLVVDDSVVARRMLSLAIDQDPALQVIGTASNGRLAMAKLLSSPCDLVTLDVEMPEVSGLEALAAIRRDYPSLPVLMCSSLTERGAATTLEALSRGANDYIAKPSTDVPQTRFAAELTDKLKALGRGLRRPPPFASVARRLVLPIAARPTHAEPAAAIAIGVSTGGPNALAEVLPNLPANLAAPVFVVQHMPPVFTKMLADRLTRLGPLPVHEAHQGQEAVTGHVYIAPGDWHMTVVRESGRVTLTLLQSPPENSCRPAVDVLFRSFASVYGATGLGVILTGMGKDGLRGCELLRAAGGRVLAQDEATSVVWGMPGFVAGAGLAEEVVPLPAMAAAITRRCRLDRAGKR